MSGRVGLRGVPNLEAQLVHVANDELADTPMPLRVVEDLCRIAGRLEQSLDLHRYLRVVSTGSAECASRYRDPVPFEVAFWRESAQQYVVVAQLFERHSAVAAC